MGILVDLYLCLQETHAPGVLKELQINPTCPKKGMNAPTETIRELPCVSLPPWDELLEKGKQHVGDMF